MEGTLKKAGTRFLREASALFRREVPFDEGMRAERRFSME